MAVNLAPIGNGFQFFTNNGAPLNAGKIYTYQAGSSTPLATYTTSSGLTANANPIILGTSGRPPNDIWLTEGFFYKFILKDSADVTIQTYDNLYGIIEQNPRLAAEFTKKLESKGFQELQFTEGRRYIVRANNSAGRGIAAPA